MTLQSCALVKDSQCERLFPGHLGTTLGNNREQLLTYSLPIGPFVPKSIDTAVNFMYYDDGLEQKFKILQEYIESG